MENLKVQLIKACGVCADMGWWEQVSILNRMIQSKLHWENEIWTDEEF